MEIWSMTSFALTMYVSSTFWSNCCLNMSPSRLQPAQLVVDRGDSGEQGKAPCLLLLQQSRQLEAHHCSHGLMKKGHPDATTKGAQQPWSRQLV
mmetsp:Transcript_79665/g.234353  ORF Transcript_79665/g.234353 Transcript_79665/m.234353 type:complete len:94 (-) Transcript_79665:16-297(-)